MSVLPDIRSGVTGCLSLLTSIKTFLFDFMGLRLWGNLLNEK
jgi:hypothetical protein